jgi:hypothetical protein
MPEILPGILFTELNQSLLKLTPMKNKFTTLILILAFCFPALLRAQFSGMFAIPNWTNVYSNSNGTTVTTGAPTSIYQVSSNGLSGSGYNDFRITMTQAGTITFSWSYSTVDGAYYDYPMVVLNGVATMVTGYSTGGGNTQSGVQAPVSVCVGDVFGFRAYSVDNVAGACTTTFSGFTFSLAPPVPVSSTPSLIACPGNTVSATAGGANTYTWNPGNYVGSTYIITTPSVNTIYTVTGSNGCALGTATTEVNTLPVPTIAVAGTASMCAGQSVNLSASGALSYTWSNGPQTSTVILNPGTTTSYSVAGTNSLDCVAQEVITVTVVPLPPLSVSGNTVICAGGSITLTANGADTYSWNTTATTPSIAATLSASTVYTVTGTSTLSGCAAMIQKSVTVNPLPQMSTTGTGIICLGQSATLSACCADGYFWSSGANTPTAVVSPTVNTTYIVNGVTAAGCTKSVTATVFVAICTGLQDQAGSGILYELYPNPTSGDIAVEVFADTRMTLFNALGQAVASEDLKAGKNQLALNVPGGIYFARLEQGGRVRTVRIVKQ